MQTPNFFSSAASLPLLPGDRVVPGSVEGYHIDLSAKTEPVDWPPDWLRPNGQWVVVAQWGLGSYERYLAGEGEEWLERALACGRYLLETQVESGAQRGGWLHLRPFRHTFPLEPNWISAMAQGEAASLLTRLSRTTGEERFADAAVLALEPLRVPSAQGGAMALLDGRPFPEEYPTLAPSFVLNGGIFAMWGYYDAWVGLGSDHREAWEDAVDLLASQIGRWDTGYWTRYDLYPHPVTNVASSAYHFLHVSQLEAMLRLVRRPELETAVARWRRYASSRLCSTRAFARKALFRVVVPRRRPARARKPS